MKIIILILLLCLICLGCACTATAPPRVPDSLPLLHAKIDTLNIRLAKLDSLLRSLKPDTFSRAAPAIMPLPDSSQVRSSVPIVRQQCQAITKAGKRCTRPAKSGRPYCWQHDR